MNGNMIDIILLFAAQKKSVLVKHLFDVQSESILHSLFISLIGHFLKNISPFDAQNIAQNTTEANTMILKFWVFILDYISREIKHFDLNAYFLISSQYHIAI